MIGDGMPCEIVNGHWSKDHVIEGVRYISRNRATLPAGPHAFEWGVYRGESLRLIEEQFYGHQIPLERSFGFDSFEGLPEEEPGVDRFYLFNKGVFADVDRLWAFRNAVLVKGWFSDLKPSDVAKHGMKPAGFVHIDGDLYVSAKQALHFMFENRLIVPGTVVAYDEFKSTDKLESGGESKAHMEAALRWGVRFREFFRNVYFDKLECWQNCFIVEEVGSDRPHHGIYGVN